MGYNTWNLYTAKSVSSSCPWTCATKIRINKKTLFVLSTHKQYWYVRVFFFLTYFKKIRITMIAEENLFFERLWGTILISNILAYNRGFNSNTSLLSISQYSIAMYSNRMPWSVVHHWENINRFSVPPKW